MVSKIIVDTREKKPIKFTAKWDIDVKKLDFGDYGYERDGELVKLVFERKSPHDLFGTLGSGHQRFKNEMERAAEADFKFIVAVECPYTTIKTKSFNDSWRIKKMKGYQIIKMIHTMEKKYPIQFLFFNDRKEMRDYICGAFEAYGVDEVKAKLSEQSDK